LLHLPCAFEFPHSPRAHLLRMPTKKVAHKEKMTKKKSENAATRWVPSELEESDLIKAQREGFLVEGEQIVFPQHQTHPQAPERLSGDVSCFPSPWSFSSCPRISSWAPLCLRCAASLAHTELHFTHCLFHHPL
jgi:hypothetical protein